MTDEVVTIDYGPVLETVPLSGSGHELVLIDGETVWRFRHTCKTVDNGDGTTTTLRISPQLNETRHHVHEAEEPADATPRAHKVLTVNPSILCPDCGVHGFVQRSEWVDVG